MLTEVPLVESLLGLDDPQRICPMLAGAALIEGNQLSVRLPNTEIRIDAPKNLLKQVFDRCDGTRSLHDCLATFRNIAEREQFASFVAFLIQSGVLIDASQMTAAASRYGWVTNAFGQAAAPELTARIATRFEIEEPLAEIDSHTHTVRTPALAQHFKKRHSSRLFDPTRVVDRVAVDTLLWSLHGVIDERHEYLTTPVPRRTIASAGAMHLLEVFLALPAAMSAQDGQPLQAGIYRIRYPGAAKIRYDKIDGDIALLPRVLAKPWYLTGAAGVIFLASPERIATLKYRNRAIQYLYMEAGAALQNGGLTATELDIGYTTFGSFSETWARELLQYPEGFMLGSAIFGAEATDLQREATSHCEPLDFAWADAPSDTYQLPYFVARVKSKYNPDNKPTWGRDTEPHLAARKAIAEHIEREGYRQPRDLVQARCADLDGAIDPRTIARFSPSQYRRKDFPFARFNPNSNIWWAVGLNTRTSAPAHVLAEFVFASASLQVHQRDRKPYWQANSSGCAAGTTFLDAQEAALLELIERDAFMRHWLTQQSGTAIDPRSLPTNLSSRLDAIQATGFDVSVQWLPSPLAQVAFLFARHPQKRMVCVAAGARHTITSAIHSALVELESRVFSLLNAHAVPPLAPRDVTVPDDHFGLYSFPKNYARADALALPTTSSGLEQIAERDNTKTTLAKMLAAGLTPILFDITPNLNGINNGTERLSVCRAVVPGLVPMSFGFGLEPRGSIENVHPASHFPHPFP